MEENLSNFGKDFLYTKITIQKIDKLDFTKIRNFCPSKVIVERMKIKSKNQKKIFAEYIKSKSRLKIQKITQ